MNLNTSNLGWIVAAGLAGIMIAGGFQTPTQKVAGADLDKVVQASDFWKANEATFNDYEKKRYDVLQYINANGVMTGDQLNEIVNMSLKDNATPQEKAELERTKADVTAQEKRREEILVKQTPLTAEERTLLDTFRQRADANSRTLDQLASKLSQDVQTKRTSIMNDAMDRARQAVQTVGKAQGCTVIYSSSSAPYTATDLTTDAISAMNAQK
jgi:Skp family chaperone for outer membrane proteins